MQITDVRIRKVEGEGKLKAYVTVTFDDCFVVHNVKIIEGSSGLFIAMPSRKTIIIESARKDLDKLPQTSIFEEKKKENKFILYIKRLFNKKDSSFNITKDSYLDN